LSYNALQEKIVTIQSKRAILDQNAAKLRIQQQLWQPQLQTLFKLVFCFIWLKNHKNVYDCPFEFSSIAGKKQWSFK
jgi:hypothetical protein